EAGRERPAPGQMVLDVDSVGPPDGRRDGGRFASATPPTWWTRFVPPPHRRPGVVRRPSAVNHKEQDRYRRRGISSEKPRDVPLLHTRPCGPELRDILRNCVH